jgi:hypothetical protein
LHGGRSDQVFETIVIFSEFSWVGKAEENPSETPMAIPAKLSEVTTEMS